MEDMLLGVHCSIAGGYSNAFAEAAKLGIDTFQIFTKNQRQWKEREVSEEEGRAFKKLMKDNGIKIAFSHSTYLINLSSADEKIALASVQSLLAEVVRCERLGLSFTVQHPGSSKDMGEELAIKKIAEGLKEIFAQTKGMKAKILLENTAGQGSSIGWKFEHIRAIMDLVKSPRLGMCLDTCHAFAAGYDLRTKETFESTIQTLDKVVGLKNLYAIHLNDSKGALGSRIDRHDHVGKGQLGLLPFRMIMERFPDLPKVLETSKEDNADEKNLALLRSLNKKSS